MKVAKRGRNDTVTTFDPRHPIAERQEARRLLCWWAGDAAAKKAGGRGLQAASWRPKWVVDFRYSPQPAFHQRRIRRRGRGLTIFLPVPIAVPGRLSGVKLGLGGGATTMKLATASTKWRWAGPIFDAALLRATGRRRNRWCRWPYGPDGDFTFPGFCAARPST